MMSAILIFIGVGFISPALVFAIGWIIYTVADSFEVVGVIAGVVYAQTLHQVWSSL